MRAFGGWRDGGRGLFVSLGATSRVRHVGRDQRRGTAPSSLSSASTPALFGSICAAFRRWVRASRRRFSSRAIWARRDAPRRGRCRGGETLRELVAPYADCFRALYKPRFPVISERVLSERSQWSLLNLRSVRDNSLAAFSSPASRAICSAWSATRSASSS
jgi:hypothetical protein